MTQLPTRPPTASELLADPVVVRAMDEAWVASLPDDPEHRHEEGGWIFMNLTTAKLTTRRARPGKQASIDLSRLPKSNGIVVGKFHTHPNPTSEGWDPGPSKLDEIVDERHGVPDLIRADDGVYVSGPNSRRGGLTGRSGYPN